MITLSERLQAVASYVPYGSRLADIGSDHALLPVWLAQAGRVRSAVAGELNEGPYLAAAKQVREAGLESSIAVRRGDGLEVLAPGEVDCVVIAGMGGSLISQILQAGVGKLTGVDKPDGVGVSGGVGECGGVKRLILQPNVGADRVRQWLLDWSWVLIEEDILEEDGKIYEILVAEKPGALDRANEQNERLYRERRMADGYVAVKETLLKMGPFLLERASPVWRKKWQGELAKLEGIAREAAQSALAAQSGKLARLHEEMRGIKEVLECMPTDTQ
ncbi:MAG: SAM-dependent methyltransferase [Paenibacillaceae bacterium]|jgi:tRNA (adenine22-N1)-methyltransferase|nr:SAM-dependent methyltransferase [Paenibacillaceae bacterium]